jgi:hypothetical protein
MSKGPLPNTTADDALYVAVATLHGMDCLLTWNCRHLANAELIGELETSLAEKRLQLPFICTPDKLMEHIDV